MSAWPKRNNLENSCAQLEEDLNVQSRDPITYKVYVSCFCIIHELFVYSCSTENEINRREGVLMGLQNRIESFKVKISQDPSQGARADLMGAGGAKRVWGETAETEGVGNAEVLDLQKRKMKGLSCPILCYVRSSFFNVEQDERLGQISRQVGTISHVGNAIHDELDEHHKLLGEVDVKVQKAQVKFVYLFVFSFY